MSLTVIILCALSGLSSGVNVLPDSVDAAVGSTVTFTTSLDPTETPFISIIWKFGVKDITSNVVNSTDPEYEDRITLFVSTGSLELRNVALSDTGEYSVNIIPEGGAQVNGLTTLNIYECITNISVKSSHQPVEGESVNLTCDASGSIFTREWMINGRELKPSENIKFYDQKRVLSFRVLTRKDNENYTCRISNPVSNQSVDYTMNVIYGPENVQISDPGNVQVGKTLKLLCSAESVPTAAYTWTHNGTTVGQSSEYTKDKTVFSDSGEYVCQATNNITMETSNGSRTVNVTALKKGLSAGAIVGISVASLGVAGASAGGIHVYKHQKGRKQNNRNTDLEQEHVYENTPNTGNILTEDENSHVYENSQNMYDLNL